MTEDSDDRTDDERPDGSDGRDRPDHGDQHRRDHQSHVPDDEHEHEDHGHDHHEHDLETVGVGVVTVSSTRSIEDDPAGDIIVEAFEDAGHEIAVRELVRDDLDGIQSTVNHQITRDDVDIVVTTGGTGVTPDDVTIDAVCPVLRAELPGFGELFRRLSYEEIGTRVIGSRALAGISRGVVIFCLPGSENAARLGTEEIIVPEAPHLAGLTRRDGESAEEVSGPLPEGD